MSSKRKTLCLALWAALRTAGAVADTPARVYTNEDLDRVSPFKGETGVTSQPAVAPDAVRPAAPRETRGADEARWRQEAERLRERLVPMRHRIEDLRLRIDQRRGKPGVLPYSDPQIVSWERDLKRWEERAHDMEDRFLERARRAGALPGWLR
jgi:hypothetical protein